MKTVKKWGIILFIVLLVAITLIIVVYNYLWSQEGIGFLGLGKGREIIPPKPTGDIDDTANAFLLEITDIENTLSKTGDSVDFIISDNKEIADFGQSYNEKDF